MPVDGTYVVEGEYLVTVERLSASDVKKKRNVPTTEQTARKPLSSSDEDNVSPKEPKQKSSFIKKLRSSFKTKEKRVPEQKEESADIASEHSLSDNNIPIQELSKSLGGSKREDNNTADEAEELDIDNTDQPISHTKYTLGTSPSPNADILLINVSDEKPLLAEIHGDLELDELIRTLDIFDIPPKSTSKSTSSTSTPSICKGSEAGEVFMDLQLSMHSCGTSSKNSLPSVQDNSDIPLPVQYLKLENEVDEVSGHEYQVLNEAAPEYELMDRSKSSHQSVNKKEFPYSAKPQISIDVIMFPSGNNEAASEASESLHYEKVLKPVQNQVYRITLFFKLVRSDLCHMRR